MATIVAVSIVVDASQSIILCVSSGTSQLVHMGIDAIGGMCVGHVLRLGR